MHKGIKDMVAEKTWELAGKFKQQLLQAGRCSCTDQHLRGEVQHRPVEGFRWIVLRMPRTADPQFNRVRGPAKDAIVAQSTLFVIHATDHSMD
jgi:hypothetical protein